MRKGNRPQYDPDYAVPPGWSLEETLDVMGLSQAELARRTGLHQVTISRIISGQEPITPETALKLETVLGVPARLWNNLEKNYRQKLAELEEKQRLRRHDEWLRRIGIQRSVLVKLGWIEHRDDKAQMNKQILSELGVHDPESFDQVYRNLGFALRKSTAFECSPGPLLLWLRRGEREARAMACASYNKERFLQVLYVIRKLSRHDPSEFLPEVRDRCAEAGVAVVYVPALPKCPVSGASRWLAKGKALIQLSGRYKKDDHFWFTLFHEAGHVVLHSRDAKRAVFLDDDSRKTEEKREKQANRFATDQLIPPDAFEAIRSIFEIEPPTEAKLIQLAERLHISPGIVVGRLQHEGLLPFGSALNRLKRDVLIT